MATFLSPFSSFGFFFLFLAFHCSINQLSFHFDVACKNIENIGFKAPISLQELHIDGCEKLMKLTINSVEGDLTSLRTVHLDNISLLKPYFKHLVCLEELVIEGKVGDSLDELPKSRLRKLFLIRCQDESFFIKGKDKTRPKDMEEFTSLKCLHLKQCNKMKCLPYLPSNLDELRIDECPLLEKQCREDGPGWANISHVPYKYIWACVSFHFPEEFH